MIPTRSHPLIWMLFFVLGVFGPRAVLLRAQEDKYLFVEPPALDMPEASDFQKAETKERDPYHMAVREYLDRNDGAAISHLKEALRLNEDNKRARQLLLKVFLRSSHTQYKQKSYKKVRSIVGEAKKYFPSDPKVKILHAAIRKRLSAVSPEKTGIVRPKSSAPKSRKAAKSRPRPARTASPPVPPKAAGRPAVAPVAPAASAGVGQKEFFLIVIIAGLLILAAFRVYAQWKSRKALSAQIKILQEAYQKQKAESAARLKELEVQKESRDRAEELYGIRKEEERKIHAELEKRKHEEENKLSAEIMQKRLKEEKRMHFELEAKKMEAERKMVSELRPQSKSEGKRKAPAPLKGGETVPAKRDIKASRTFAQYQERQITELLADVPSSQRKTAWERIATQAVSLYETSPAEAVHFFQNLVKDKNPLARASIVSALARIGSQSALDILLELRHDSHPEVKKEVLKSLKSLQQNGNFTIPDSYRRKINDFLQEEKTRIDWVF